MKRKVITDHQSQITKKKLEKPEIVPLRELQNKDPIDEIKRLEKEKPHVFGEQTASGSMPNPEVVTSITTFERAQIMRKKVQ